MKRLSKRLKLNVVVLLICGLCLNTMLIPTISKAKDKYYDINWSVYTVNQRNAVLHYLIQVGEKGTSLVPEEISNWYSNVDSFIRLNPNMLSSNITGCNYCHEYGEFGSSYYYSDVYDAKFIKVLGFLKELYNDHTLFEADNPSIVIYKTRSNELDILINEYRGDFWSSAYYAKKVDWYERIKVFVNKYPNKYSEDIKSSIDSDNYSEVQSYLTKLKYETDAFNDNVEIITPTMLPLDADIPALSGNTPVPSANPTISPTAVPTQTPTVVPTKIPTPTKTPSVTSTPTYTEEPSVTEEPSETVAPIRTPNPNVTSRVRKASGYTVKHLRMKVRKHRKIVIKWSRGKKKVTGYNVLFGMRGGKKYSFDVSKTSIVRIKAKRGKTYVVKVRGYYKKHNMIYCGKWKKSRIKVRK